jgi:hypothetical protein
MEAENSQITELALAVLDARDYAIGAAAELGELRFRHEQARQEIDSLIHQLNIIHGSRTWKVGELVLKPLRLVQKVLRLIKG